MKNEGGSRQIDFGLILLRTSKKKAFTNFQNKFNKFATSMPLLRRIKRIHIHAEYLISSK